MQNNWDAIDDDQRDYKQTFYNLFDDDAIGHIRVWVEFNTSLDTMKNETPFNDKAIVLMLFVRGACCDVLCQHNTQIIEWH